MKWYHVMLKENHSGECDDLYGAKKYTKITLWRSLQSGISYQANCFVKTLFQAASGAAIDSRCTV